MIATVVRPALASLRYQVRVNLTTPSAVLIFIFTPIIFGSVSVLFLSSYDAPELSTQVLLGSAIVAVWTTSLMLSNITLGNERWSGVVELFLATPTRLGTLIVGKLLANAVQGLVAAAIALAVITAIHPTSISFDDAGLLLGSAVLATVSIGALAFAWAPTLFLSRSATPLFFVLDTFLVFVSAVFFPPSRLPDWIEPLSRLSPLRWASEALTTATNTSDAGRETYEAWAMLAVLGIAYALAGLLGFSLLERRLRRTGELSTF